MKIGIVVPYSWSFWGGVQEHADHQARALRRLGHDARIIMGHDPPGRLTWLLHPKQGRHTRPPEYVMPVGRSVIVPANASLPNLILSPQAMRRMRRIWEQERFDVVHVHEPLAPVLSPYALASAPCPIVVTCHSAGERLGWYPIGGRLLGRARHAGSTTASPSRSRPGALRSRTSAGPFEVIPNGIDLPPEADPGGRNGNVVFIGRNEPRKGLPVLLRAWPEVHARTGARLRLIGADPLSVRWLARRRGFSLAGVDLLGGVHDEELTAELQVASLLVAPSLGGESFGMVLTRAFSCATPVVASDIEGYAQVADHDETGILVPPGDAAALERALVELLQDEARRQAYGAAAQEGRGAVLLGADRRSAPRDLRAARRSGRGGRDGSGGMKRAPARMRPPRSRAGRLLLVLVPMAALVGPRRLARARIRAPSSGRFARSSGSGSPSAVLINLFSVVVRAFAWNIVIKQAIPPPWPRRRTVFSAFCVGLLGNAALPGRVGELARVAVVTRHVRRRPGTWATIVGTVFAHRLFDVVASVVLVLVTLYVAPIPDWASPVLAVARRGRARAAHRRLPGRTPAPPHRSPRSSAPSAACCTWRAVGSPCCGGPARPSRRSSSSSSAGRRSSPPSTRRSLRSASTASVEAAALVLVVMNVVMIFPFWPGNVGLVQAAVAAALLPYGVSYAHGVVFGIGLQAIEASVGIGLGFLFLAREGFTFAMLRRMPEVTDVDVDEDERVERIA